MKKILVLLIMLFAIFGMTSCGELYGDEDCLKVNLNLDGSKTCTVSLNENSKIKPTYLTIPETIMGYTVIAVTLDNTFPRLTTLELPKTAETVTGSISKLKVLKYSGTLNDFIRRFAYVGGYEADSNANYNSLFGYHGAKFYVTENGEYKEVTDLTIPSDVKALRTGLFRYCDSLESVTFLGNTDISYECFYHCTNLKSVTFNKDYSDIRIGNAAFGYCEKLENVSFPEGIKNICSAMFHTNIKEITIPEGVTTVDIYDWSLSEISIPSTVQKLSIGDEHIKTIEIAEGLEELVEGAFGGCYKLNKLILPKTIKKIEERVFGSCRSLKEITYNGTKADWTKISIDSLWRKDSKVTKIICTDGVIDYNE